MVEGMGEAGAVRDLRERAGGILEVVEVVVVGEEHGVEKAGEDEDDNEDEETMEWSSSVRVKAWESRRWRGVVGRPWIWSKQSSQTRALRTRDCGDS